MLTICRLLVFLAISLLDSRIHASLYSITLMGFYSTDGDELAFFCYYSENKKVPSKAPKIFKLFVDRRTDDVTFLSCNSWRVICGVRHSRLVKFLSTLILNTRSLQIIASLQSLHRYLHSLTLCHCG